MGRCVAFRRNPGARVSVLSDPVHRARSNGDLEKVTRPRLDPMTFGLSSES